MVSSHISIILYCDSFGLDLNKIITDGRVKELVNDDRSRFFYEKFAKNSENTSSSIYYKTCEKLSVNIIQHTWRREVYIIICF